MILPLLLLVAQAVSPELAQHVNAGLAAKAAGDLDRAIREFRQVVELAPTLPAAHVNLGAVYFEKQDYANVIGPLRQALALNPNLPGAHQMLGTALLAQGAAAGAIPHLEKAQIPALLGIAYLEAGRPRDAVDPLEVALLARPADPDLTYYLSQAYRRLAQQLFENLRANPEAIARTQQTLGEAAAAAGQNDAAGKHFRAALASRPELRGIQLAIGELHLANANYAAAETAFRAEAALAPSSAIAAYQLGYVLAQRGQSAAARAELTRAYELAPEVPETSLELGKAQAAAGESAAAETALLRVLHLKPPSKLAEAAYLQLNQLYRKLNRPAEADRALRSLQDLRRKSGR